MGKRLIVFDGMHVAYRNRFVMKDLKNKEGKCTGAIYGTICSVKRMMRNYPDYKVIFCWDKMPTKRKKLDPTYKANREDKPDWFPDFLEEVETLKNCLKLLGVDQYSAMGYEADDVAYYITERYKKDYSKNDHLILVTGDSDWFQLVDDDTNVCVMRPGKEEKIFKSDDVCKEYGIPHPSKIVFFKIFRGDKSDNVPGIPRFPTKLIQSLAREYNDIYGVITYVDTNDLTKGTRWGQAIKDNEERIILNDKLVNFYNLRTPVRKVLGEYNEDELVRQYRRLGFNSLKNEIIKQRMRR